MHPAPVHRTVLACLLPRPRRQARAGDGGLRDLVNDKQPEKAHADEEGLVHHLLHIFRRERVHERVEPAVGHGSGDGCDSPHPAPRPEQLSLSHNVSLAVHKCIALPELVHRLRVRHREQGGVGEDAPLGGESGNVGQQIRPVLRPLKHEAVWYFWRINCVHLYNI